MQIISEGSLSDEYVLSAKSAEFFEPAKRNSNTC